MSSLIATRSPPVRPTGGDHGTRPSEDRRNCDRDVGLDRLLRCRPLPVDGDDRSSTSVRAKIRKLIGAENPAKPLSDSKIANMLAAEGINVARRTVAKYREAMKITSSSERKVRKPR